MASDERPVPSPRVKPPAAVQPPALPKKKKVQTPSSEFHIVCLSPSSVIYNKHDPVVVVLNQSLPNNVEYTIKFIGKQTRTETACDAQKIGDNVLTFRAPEHYPPEDVELSVHHGSQLAKLCTCISFSFKTYLQKLRDTLINASDPIDFMCASLHLRQRNVVALDFELEKQFLKNTPPDFDLLANHDTGRMKEYSTQEGDPTLLHFAARYNLIKLAVAILRCPGGYNALSICNVDGYTPSQIARECGHENLAYVLADAQQHHNITVEPTDIYESMHDPIYNYYVTVFGNTDDDIYVPMDANGDDDSIYEKMMPQEEIYENSDTYLSGYAAETTSLASVSSTGSSDSSGSAGSGPVDGRPPIPRPRQTQSHNEADFRAKFGIQREVKSMKERGTKKHSGDRYSSLPKGMSPQSAYFQATNDRQDSPPPLPPSIRHSNIYQ